MKHLTLLFAAATSLPAVSEPAAAYFKAEIRPILSSFCQEFPKVAKKTPMRNLHLALLQRMGVLKMQYGDSTSVLLLG